MARDYGHSVEGVNIANYRMVHGKKTEAQSGYRTLSDWTRETAAHVCVGHAENQLSSTLRHSSNLVQEAAAELVVADITSVEAALRAKLRQTEQLKDALEMTIADTVNEMQQCAVLKGSLQQRLSKVHEKMALNTSRMQVRTGRPSRERTMDDVEGTLLAQQGLMQSFVERIRRASAHLDREMQQLERVCHTMQADLKDKIGAIEVDTRVLNVQQGDSPSEVCSLQYRSSGGTFKTPQAWVVGTMTNIKEAQKWISDSVRLRKAIRYGIQSTRSAEHNVARALNTHMMTKVTQIKGLKEDLEGQLSRIREEQSRVDAQRNSLAQSLEAKRGPLTQAKERFAARKGRPSREQVQDDVDAALATEIAHLHSVTSQLAYKLKAVDKTRSSLDLAALTLEDNIHDKEVNLSVEERMVLLDGRISFSTAPPSSIASSANSHLSAVHEATLRRIGDLEGELHLARKEREGMEARVKHLRTSLPSSPKGPLSPTRLQW